MIDEDLVSISDVKSLYGQSVIIQAQKTDNLENFRVRFQSAKERRGATLAQIAEACGVGISTVGAWAQGKNFPEVDVQPKLAAFLHVSVQFLIHGIPVNNTGFTDKQEVKTYPEIRENPDGRRRSNADRVQEVTVNPSYTPSGIRLTRDQVERYLSAYLDFAEQVPGGVEHAYIELTEALSLEKIRRRAEKAKG